MAGSRLIDTYLSELRKNLAGRSDLEDVLAEVEDHLHEVAAGHVRCGMDERTAERHALGQFGSTELVTRAFVESSRRGVSAPTRTTRLAGMAGIVGGATMIPLFGLASISDLDVGGTTTWFAPLATTAGLLALSGIVGLHLRHRALYGRAGRIGRTLIPAAVLLLLASAATWFAPGLYVAEAALAIALALVGRDIWRAGVVDRRALTLVAVSLPSIVLVGMFSTGGFEWTTVASIVAFAAAGTGFAWLGHGLWRERAEPDGAPTALA